MHIRSSLSWYSKTWLSHTNSSISHSMALLEFPDCFLISVASSGLTDMSRWVFREVAAAWSRLAQKLKIACPFVELGRRKENHTFPSCTRLDRVQRGWFQGTVHGSFDVQSYSLWLVAYALYYVQFVLAESLAICRYLAHQFGWFGSNPHETAHIDMYCESWSEIHQKYWPLTWKWNKLLPEETIEKELSDLRTNVIIPILTKHEEALAKNGTGYYVGDKVSVLAKNEASLVVPS